MSNLKSLAALALAASLAISGLGAQPAAAFELVAPKADSGNVVIETNTAIHDTVFGTGNDVDVRGTIDHDAVFAGKNVAFHQLVGNNVFAAGSTVHISGQVMGDVYIMGQNVSVDDDATVMGDVIAIGDTVHLGGTIHGKIRAYGRALAIHGTIGKDVIVNASDVSLSSTAVITGNLTGTVATPLSQASDAIVRGQTNLERTNTASMNGPSSTGAAGAMIGLLIIFLLTMVGGMLTSILAPTMTERIRTQLNKQSLQAGLVGLVALLVSLPLFFILLAMIITIPVAFFELSALSAIMLLGHVFAILWIGDLTGKSVAKKQWSIIGALTVGTIVYLLLGMIPLIGPLLGFVAFTVGLGAVLIDLWQHYLRTAK